MRGAAGSADRFPLGGGSAGRILTSCSFPLSVDLIPVLSQIRRGDAERKMPGSMFATLMDSFRRPSMFTAMPMRMTPPTADISATTSALR